MKLRLLLHLLVCLAASAAAGADEIRVLIVTGIDHPAHQWRETAPALRALLEKDGRLSVRIVEDPNALDTAALSGYRAVVLHFQNWQAAAPGAAARENLRRFVEAGGGLASVHFACGAWHGEWPEFQNILVRVWRGIGGPQHDRRGPFKVRIADRGHPITAGLGDFETDDELYTCLVGEQPMHLLAAATSKADQREHPMAFIREYGKGRVFLTTLGHDVKALSTPATAELIRRGVAWAANQSP